MQRWFIRSAAAVGVLWAMSARFAAADTLDVIPKPRNVHLVPGGGQFHLTPRTRVLFDGFNPESAAVARQLVYRLNAAGVKVAAAALRGAAMAAPADTITITAQGANQDAGDEGYSLTVTPQRITIAAPYGAGRFYGMQTLLQLLPPSVYGNAAAGNVDWTVPTGSIVDSPRFRWRGLLLDVSRHFEPKDKILQLLDEMAIYKLNVFHWHLTDDQGWRIEIKKYPKLTQIGAWRDSAGFGLDPKLSTTYRADGKYGGFYTQDDVREVVAYAARLHIMVVPEIEMPGHASAARRAYPQFFVPASAAEPGQTKGDAGIFNGIYDPANEQTFTFLQDVLTETMDLFPSPYIHIGGDEVPKGPWEHNPADIAFMKAHHLASADQLQSYFVKRIEKFLSSHGRHMIGWDEILEGGLAPGATVMSWRGIEGGRTAASADHDVVMTPTSYCYLDGEQGRGTEPHERGALLTVEKVYRYEPIPGGLPASLVHHVLGLQGNLWTEYVPNFPWAQYMIWPREAAIAEIGWSSPTGRNWDDFANRLHAEEQRWEVIGVNYRPTIDDGLLKHAMHLDADHKLAIDTLPGCTIRYTLDGAYPSSTSPIYTGPTALPGGWVQVCARYFHDHSVSTAASAATFLDGRAVTVSSTMPKDWDARQTSFFTPLWGGGADDTVTVRFDGGPQTVHQLTVVSGSTAAPDTRLKQGVLEISSDGKDFMQVAKFGDDGTAHADLGGKDIAAFRIRFLAMQMPHPIIKTVAIH